jgi:hypothetical protein
VFWLLLLFFLTPSRVFAVDPIVKISNFSSNTLPEWVEINNTTDDVVNIENWIIKDDNDLSTDDLTISGCLSPHSYQTYYHTTNWLNNGGDTIYLYDNQLQLIDQLIYTTGKTDTSPKSDNTCVATPTPVPTATLTPIPISTSAPLPTITPSSTPVPTNTFTPSPTKTPTPTHTPTPTRTPTPSLVATEVPLPSEELLPADEIIPSPVFEVLGSQDTITQIATSSTKFKLPKNLLPSLLIGTGSAMLLLPLLLSKLKHD